MFAGLPLLAGAVGMKAHPGTTLPELICLDLSCQRPDVCQGALRRIQQA